MNCNQVILSINAKKSKVIATRKATNLFLFAKAAMDTVFPHLSR